jgi:prevent-host-death family protein
MQRNSAIAIGVKMISIAEAQECFFALVAEVEAGGRVILTRDGLPVVEIVPHWSKDFDEPLPEDFLIRPLP